MAVQTEPSGGLTLMLDYGIFYEFVPVEDLGRDRPRRHTVADVEVGRAYAIALSTPAGLWSYLLGDTVRVTAHHPLRLEITGRTRHFVNAFGENVIVEEVEHQIAEQAGVKPVSVEGLEDASWVLLDYGDLVVHVFLDETRAYYDLERLWADAPAVEWEEGVPAAASAE